MHRLIHPLSEIHARCSIGKHASIGAFGVVGEGVCLKDNVTLAPHSVVQGKTTIGSDSSIGSFSCIGSPHQSKRSDQVGETIVGSECVVREHVSVHAGTGLATRIGNGTWLLAGSHIGHDSQIGSNVVISGGSQIAGHVIIGSHAVIGGLVGIQQFCVIGKGAMVGGGSMVDRHVPPYSLVAGNRATFRGINLRGLRRRGIPNRMIFPLLQAARQIFQPDGSSSIDSCRQLVSEKSELLDPSTPETILVREFVEFILMTSEPSQDWHFRRASTGLVAPFSPARSSKDS